jgi:hypothetical protein
MKEENNARRCSCQSGVVVDARGGIVVGSVGPLFELERASCSESQS